MLLPSPAVNINSEEEREECVRLHFLTITLDIDKFILLFDWIEWISDENYTMFTKLHKPSSIHNQCLKRVE